MSSAPIANLSYRNYDGPLEDPRFRWWVISKQTIRLAFAKRSMWWAVAFAGWYYLGMIFVLFVIDQMSQAQTSGLQANPARNNVMASFMQRIVWKDQFVHGFSFGQMFFLIMALILGAGAIANDNRANALLVYLSKPCSKFDYLFGKWFGVFLPLFVVMAVPSLVFYAYGALSYREYGFFFQDPWMFAKLMLVLPIGAGFHASMITGISAMFNQGRIAGATYAGIYFLSNFFTKAMTIAWIGLNDRNEHGNGPPAAVVDTVKNLFYASIDGLNIGMSKAILGTDGSPYFGIPSDLKMVPAPPLWPVLGIIFAMSFISLAIAWRKIRAVEVVG